MSDRPLPGDMRHGWWKRAVAKPRARTVAMTIFGDNTARSMERLSDGRSKAVRNLRLRWILIGS